MTTPITLSNTAYSQRIAVVQEALREQNFAAAVLSSPAQMQYLTGWSENGHERLLALFLPAQGDPAFIVPAMNAPQAQTNPAGVEQVYGWGDDAGWQPLVRDLLSEWGLQDRDGRGLAIDDDLMSIHLLDLQAIAPHAKCTAAGPFMARFREIKTAEELALMERSAQITDTVYSECLSALREGMTENDLQDMIAQLYKAHGTRPEFALICFGANCALPHHSSGRTPLKQGDTVIIDIGCRYGGYFSDITRTVAFGRPEPEALHVYRTVFAAQHAAFEAGRPGVTCEAVDEAARSVIAQADYGEFFMHRTGHGIGLSGHEPPYIVAGNRQELREGMCFSDEPGIYLPGRFGVRIENIVTVEADGLRYLNTVPPDEMVIVEKS